MRNATCAASKTLKVPTQDALLFISYSMVQGFHDARIFPGRRRNCVGEGSVSIAYITQSFRKFIVSLFCPIPPPMRAALCKLLGEVGNTDRNCDIFV